MAMTNHLKAIWAYDKHHTTTKENRFDMIYNETMIFDGI